MKTGVCSVCGRYRKIPREGFCHGCYAIFLKKSRHEPKTRLRYCVVCSKSFKTGYSRQQTCSKKCGIIRIKQQTEARKYYLQNKIEKNPLISDTSVNPKNEQEVVFLFALVFKELGFSSIERISSTVFPDCIATNKEGKEVRIEFEFTSKGFKEHKHNLSMCDMVICWNKDCDLDIPIVELKEVFKVWLIKQQQTTT